MNTRWLLGSCAVVLGVAGLALTFAPAEVAALAGWVEAGPPPLVLQLLGAAYLALALLDWMVRRSVIGGIYGRPVVVANLVHFTVAAFAALGAEDGVRSAPVLAVAAVCAAFAVAFGWVMMRHPGERSGGPAMPESG